MAETNYTWAIINGEPCIINNPTKPDPTFPTESKWLWKIDTGFAHNGFAPIQMFGAFAESNNLTNIRIPPSVKKIGRQAFKNTQLTSVTIAKDCEYYDTSFPEGCVVNYY